ncbi:hypothetical protein BDB01DRAFT_779806 [Pilobolus umbonatus]|nr:hypothetical protein BDB01DRAFT_779806 [Pilobolus umbonatus]
MAFQFNWPEFDTLFYSEARSQLEAALNKNNKPKNIVDHISVKELNMGTIAPDLEILEIGELSTDKFRGIFKLNYSGDAYIVIQTKVQANPMHSKQSDLPRHTRPGILAADQPLVVPMLLRISELKLRGIVVLVVSKTKGITLVFKNDPLESIDISSTFDSVTSVRNFLQREIEKQLRNLFQADLPVMIHNLSIRHIQSQQAKKEKEEREWVCKIDREKGVSKPPLRSVFSDPGVGISSSVHYDTFSMPDIPSSPLLSSSVYCQLNKDSIPSSDFLSYGHESPSYLDTLSHSNKSFPRTQINPLYSTFSDLYYANQSVDPSTFFSTYDGYSSQNSVPVTAANLSTLNQLYSSRFASLKTPPYSDYGHNGLEDDCLSCPNDTSSTNSMIAAEIYANDADAPWYITEGPEFPSLHGERQTTLTMMAMDEDIIINPQQNTIALKLAQLACVNYTLSPLAPTIHHYTYRSLPHAVKVGTRPRHKKPKRRIIRLNTT